MLTSLLLFALGLGVLVWGGDRFVEGAVGLAGYFRLPEVLIGATVVSVGTTLPEVMVSAASALGDHGELSYGNAVGSVLCNAALIAGLSIAIRPGKVDREELKRPTLFFFLAAAVYCLSAYGFGGLGRGSGFALLGIFLWYLAVTLHRFRGIPGSERAGGSLRRELLWLILGTAAIALGADLLVDHGTVIARELGVPETVIGLTLVALGTSLPELSTAVTALLKGHSALSLGNILGANLFDLVLVSGTAAVIAPFPIPEGKPLWSGSATLLLDLPLMLVLMALLTLPVLLRGRTYRWQGLLLLTLYAVFCALQYL